METSEKYYQVPVVVRPYVRNANLFSDLENFQVKYVRQEFAAQVSNCVIDQESDFSLVLCYKNQPGDFTSYRHIITPQQESRIQAVQLSGVAGKTGYRINAGVFTAKVYAAALRQMMLDKMLPATLLEVNPDDMIYGLIEGRGSTLNERQKLLVHEFQLFNLRYKELLDGLK